MYESQERWGDKNMPAGRHRYGKYPGGFHLLIPTIVHFHPVSPTLLSSPLPQFCMRDRNNPLKQIPPRSFTVIQTSHDMFQKDLADIPARYPCGRITYLNNHRFVPLLRLREEDRNRLDHREIQTFDELISTIESDRSAILFIEYGLTWFKVDYADQVVIFTDVCRTRARKGGPVVVITAAMDRGLLSLEGKADYFFQIGKEEHQERRLRTRNQKRLDEIPAGKMQIGEKGRMYGQMKLGEW